MDILEYAVGIARKATAHNEGNTVPETYISNGWTVLEMSSWPRAQEALKEFAKHDDLEVYYANTNKIGVRYASKKRS